MDVDKNTKEEFTKKEGGFKAEPLETLIQKKRAENLDPTRKTEKTLTEEGRESEHGASEMQGK